MQQTNWSGNVTYSSDVIEIDSLSHLQRVIHEHDEIKVVATGHTFNDIANSSIALISLHQMSHILELNEDAQTVTIEPGVRYGELAIALHEAGYALHNLASLPHISVVGACATGTHGSGIHNGNLATGVTGIELIDARGTLRRFTQEDHEFNGFPINLGATGIITQLTLAIEPTYDVRQTVFTDMQLADYLTNFDAIMSAGYSVSAFTDWQDETIKQVWVKQRSHEQEITELFSAIKATHHYHPIADVSPRNCTPQMGHIGAWHERLPHFQLAFTPSKGDELQSEYFVDRQDAAQAIQALSTIGEKMRDVLLVSEIRCIAADDLWMSPCYQRDSVAFHFTWQSDWSKVRVVLLEIERVLEPFAPRPHMGKLFTMPIETIRSRYPRFNDFRDLVHGLDPDGKFRNRYLRALLDE